MFMCLLSPLGSSSLMVGAESELFFVFSKWLRHRESSGIQLHEGIDCLIHLCDPNIHTASGSDKHVELRMNRKQCILRLPFPLLPPKKR